MPAGNPTWNNASGIVFGIFSILGIIATIISAGLVYFHRENIIIKAARYVGAFCFRVLHVISNLAFTSLLTDTYMRALVV